MSNNSLKPKEIAIVEFNSNEDAVNYLISLGFRQAKNNWFPDWEQEHFNLFRNLPHTASMPMPDFMFNLANEDGFRLHNYREYFSLEWQRVLEVYVATSATTKYRWLKRKIGYAVPPNQTVLKDNVIYMWLERPIGFSEGLVLQDAKDLEHPRHTRVISDHFPAAHGNVVYDKFDLFYALSEREWKEAIQHCVDAGLTLNKRFLSAIAPAPLTAQKPDKNPATDTDQLLWWEALHQTAPYIEDDGFGGEESQPGSSPSYSGGSIAVERYLDSLSGPEALNLRPAEPMTDLD